MDEVDHHICITLTPALFSLDYTFAPSDYDIKTSYTDALHSDRPTGETLTLTADPSLGLRIFRAR